jgi:hypothetical protein
MAVMGERSQTEWSEELREHGQVVFTVRRSWVLKLLGVVWLLTLAQALRIPYSSPTEDKFRIVLASLFLLMAVGSSAWYGWRIVKHYPALTVDQQGIRMGRTRFLPWAEVGKIGFVRGGLGQKRVPIAAKTQGAKELSIDQSAIKDIPAFARWLEGVLAEHRTS